jgi:hypothetical protein
MVLPIKTFSFDISSIIRKTMSRRADDASHAMTGVGSASSTSTVTALGVDHFVARVRG